MSETMTINQWVAVWQEEGAAAPLWKSYMQSVVDMDNYNVGVFEFIDDYIKRKDLIQKDIDLKIGLLDSDGVDKRNALFKLVLNQ